MGSADSTWQTGRVSRAMREQRNGHRGAVIWLTGLSAAGKTTLANRLEKELFDRGCQVVVLDGDNLRRGLNEDLGFDPAGRRENIRRVGAVAKMFADAGHIVLAAFISPYRRDRRKVRSLLLPGAFIEVYVRCQVETCIHRDPKGLYARALAGELEQFTGVSAPYEEPERAEIIIDTTTATVEESIASLLKALEARALVEPGKPLWKASSPAQGLDA